MSFRQYLLDTMEHGERLLETITPLPIADDHPCECCGGRGVIAQKSQFYRMDSDLTLIEKRSGGAVSLVTAIRCPACSGQGVDRESVLNSRLEVA